jgi:hypothetical protein
MSPEVRILLTKMGLMATAFMLVITPSVQASEVETLNQLNELINAKRYQQAYTLANQNIMAYGGEPKFDFLMGMASLKTKAYEDAVFAFERVVIIKPEWEQARIELARSYYYINNLAAAKNELLKLKKESTNTDFGVVITRFIEQVDKAIIDKKRSFKQIASFSTGFDSNINSGTALNEVYLPQLGTEIPLSQASKETKDTPFNISYQAQYQKALTQNSAIIGQLGLYHTDYANTPQFERTLADITVNYQDVLGSLTYQVGMFFRPMILDGHHYRNQYGALSNWTLPISAHWSTGGQVGFGSVDNRQNSALDLTDVYASISLKYRAGSWQHALMANHTDVSAVEPSSKHRSHQFFKFDYQTRYILTAKHQLMFDIQYQKFNYDVIDPSFGFVRDESFLRSTIGWRYIANDWMMWQLHYRYSDKNSKQNISTIQTDQSIYAYTRDELSIGITMQF